ncbi:DUF2730 family protein [Pseudovibrio sp. Tun.PSC04-5.I4]|uniref:DUF2730 family protein n=1 Tax=Pseudovibrio sp. Tun.PSC04-5.I4 TaxID=1798213 RepID=UPI00087F7CBF|nr:DUF2730 family protein [Pseudovibrio sp. Tun.PSC04-5.I4]SDR07866.1 Protein of unknown function [Pseudovibrio sp. Tun.PSC04-5.I4]
MSPEELKTWVAIVLGVISLGGTTWSIISHRSRDNSSKIEEMQGQISEAKAGVKALEREMQHLPSKEQVHQLELNMSDMGGSVKAINESIRSLRHVTEGIDDYLRQKKGS